MSPIHEFIESDDTAWLGTGIHYVKYADNCIRLTAVFETKYSSEQLEYGSDEASFFDRLKYAGRMVLTYAEWRLNGVGGSTLEQALTQLKESRADSALTNLLSYGPYLFIVSYDENANGNWRVHRNMRPDYQAILPFEKLRDFITEPLLGTTYD